VQGLSELSSSFASRVRATDSRLDAQQLQHEHTARRTDALTAAADALRVEIATLKCALEDQLSQLAQAERRVEALAESASVDVRKESSDRLLGEAALRERIKATEASLLLQEGKLKLAITELERVHKQLEPLQTAVSGTFDGLKSLKVDAARRPYRGRLRAVTRTPTSCNRCNRPTSCDVWRVCAGAPRDR
jgi:hypothetical protein